MGSPGNLVAGVIDNTGLDLFTDGNNIYIAFEGDRHQALLGDYMDASRSLLDEINSFEGKYKALYTYVPKRKIETGKTHKYISIDCSSVKASNWVLERAQKMTPDVNDKITSISIMNFSIVNNYAADYVISLEDIIEGRLITKLKEFVDEPLDESLYNAWLSPTYHNFTWL